jgi:hypothetical protein
VTLYSRNVVECIKALYGDAEFAPHLVFSPERHYTGRDKSQRIYHELHTGEWWWEAQVSNSATTLLSVTNECNRRYLRNVNVALQLFPLLSPQTKPNLPNLAANLRIHFILLLATSQNTFAECPLIVAKFS